MPTKTSPTAALAKIHPYATVDNGEYLTNPYGAFYLQRRVDCGSWIGHTDSKGYPGDLAFEILPRGDALYVFDADRANAAIAAFIDEMEATDAEEDQAYKGQRRDIAREDLRQILVWCAEPLTDEDGDE